MISIDKNLILEVFDRLEAEGYLLMSAAFVIFTATLFIGNFVSYLLTGIIKLISKFEK